MKYELADEEVRHHFLGHKLSYGRPAGADGLREAIADMHGVSAECGAGCDRRIGGSGRPDVAGGGTWSQRNRASAWIRALFCVAESLGLETRFYGMRKENNFSVDIEEVMKLADARTKLILVNSPHNPTGATMSDAEMDRLHEFTSARGIQLVSDEVYHPIYHGRETKSAGRDCRTRL